jgi:hypothetical protein
MSQASRWRRRRVIALAAILILLVGYTGCDFWAERRLASALAPIQAKYGVLSGEAPRGPEVPALENRARLVKAAAALANPGTPDQRSALTRFRANPAPQAVPPELRAYLETNAESLRIARQFRTRSATGFGLQYGMTGERPPLLDMRTLSNVLYVASVQAIDARQPDEAASLIAAGMALSSSTRHEPDLITQLIRIAIADPPVDALQQLLQQIDVPKRALDELAAALAENRDPAPMTVGLIGEVRLVHSGFAALAAGRHNDQMAVSLPWIAAPPLSRLMRPMIRWSHAQYLEEVGGLLDQQTGPRPRPALPERPQGARWSFVGLMSATLIPGLARAVQSGDDFASQQAAAEVAVALGRFKLDLGVYPDALSALVPTYLSSVPIDPFTGEVPVYSRDDKGFTLTLKRSDAHAKVTRPTIIWQVQR